MKRVWARQRKQRRYSWFLFVSWVLIASSENERLQGVLRVLLYKTHRVLMQGSMTKFSYFNMYALVLCMQQMIFAVVNENTDS